MAVCISAIVPGAYTSFLSTEEHGRSFMVAFQILGKVPRDNLELQQDGNSGKHLTEYRSILEDFKMFKDVCLFVCLEIEREHTQAGEGQRKRGRETIPSRLRAVSTEPGAGLDPMTVRS